LHANAKKIETSSSGRNTPIQALISPNPRVIANDQWAKLL